jgi:hypothetical protein
MVYQRDGIKPPAEETALARILRWASITDQRRGITQVTQFLYKH